ncbi:MAG: serine/threonine-protein kinase [Gemmatimonadaceae bacterium]
MITGLSDQLQAVLGAAYEVERELGGGGMSRLFVATERSLGRPVVIKVLPPELSGEVSAARFQREIAVTAHLQHPHILPILAAGAGDELLYYVMPFVEGESLRHRLARGDPLPLPEALRLLREVADALAFAHEHGVIHRDVKPANILLTGKHATLADFGIAQAVAGSSAIEKITGTGHFVGTTQYMAPEQLAYEGDVDGRADVFALGVVAYEALAGVMPFAGTSPGQYLAACVNSTPKPLADLRPDIPAALNDLVARALAPALDARLPSAAEFRDALDEMLTARESSTARSRRVRWLAVAGAIVAAVTAGIVLRRPSPPMDDDLIAIAPFDVLQPDLALWREGFVDVLSSNLDGAGPLRTVPPAVVLRQWTGRANLQSATELAKRTGARFVVIGRVVGTGRDSARVTAAVADAVTGRRGEEVELRDAVTRMDRVADSLTLALLREVAHTRPVSVVRRASIGSSSLPALRAFLEGEQYFRRTSWDSALASYKRAVTLDSTFALAHAHMGLTYAWQRFGADSMARVHALRAGALNHGLAPRESLLITSDSLRGAAYAYGRDPLYWRHARRMLATLAEATRRYDQDAEAWYRLADAQFHFALGPRLSVPDAEIRRTFDRALALDSAFEPAYIHAVELGFGDENPARGLAYARAYLSLKPTDLSAAGTSLAVRLFDPTRRDDATTRRIIDTASADVLFQAYSAARRAVDTSEVAVTLLRAMTKVRHADYAALGNPVFVRNRLALQLSYRGHLREAAAIPEARRASLFAQMALMGAIPPKEAQLVMAEWLRDDPRDAFLGTPALVAAAAWWAAQRDTVSLERMRRRAEVVPIRPPGPGDDAIARYEGAVAGAYLALARGDTVDASRRFASLPDTLCPLCVTQRLTQAQLLAARGAVKEAAEILGQRVSLLPSMYVVMLAMEEARVAERRGDLTYAKRRYEFVTRAWSNADPELSGVVNEARVAIRRVSR